MMWYTELNGVLFLTGMEFQCSCCLYSLHLMHNIHTLLDPFAGTGYLTACFALMVGPEGHAIGVEHIPELVSFSIENIKRSAAAQPMKDGSLSVHEGGMFYNFCQSETLKLFNYLTTKIQFHLM